jgi:DNA-binding NtrC family response regulator
MENSSEPITVLLVDDEVEFATTLAKVLRRRGLEVQVANGSQEALRLVSKENFQVVLLDVKMPEKDGLTLFKEVREISPHTSVILMTGHISPEEERSGRSVGAFAYLLKPYPIPDLVELIQKAARRVSGGGHSEKNHERGGT